MKIRVGFFKSIQFKLIIIYVLLIIIAMQIISVYFIRQLEERLLANYFEMLDERTNLLAYNLEQEMTRQRENNETLVRDIDELLREFFNVENATVQVIDRNKVVISTTDMQNQKIIGQQSTEVRVKRALLGMKVHGDILRDPQTGHRVRVMAVPIQTDNETIGAIYIEASLEEIYEQVKEANNILITGTFIGIGITIVLIILLSRTITSPILSMNEQAKRMAEGDFSRQVPVYGDDEIGQLAMSFNDLTTKLKEANASKEREQKRLSSVLTHMTDGVIATDQYGKVILLNKRAEELLEMPRELVLGKFLPDVLRIQESTATFDLSKYNDSILLDFSNDEREYILEASFTAIQKDDGPTTGLIAILHDVTEKQKIEQERKEFVANVSHELRTPLTTLKSYLEALEYGAIDDKETAGKFIKVMQNETERMIRLVTDLLQLSKMDSKDFSIQWQFVDFQKYLHETIDRFEMLAEEKKITFVRHIPPYPVLVEMDKDKITQVIDNIVSNALKYAPQNSEITIRLKEEEEGIRVFISDQGHGIPREQQSKIFDRFYRIDKARARKMGGTGLGLAIAKELVQAHGGEIGVDSIYGYGTTIFFTLPYKASTKRVNQ